MSANFLATLSTLVPAYNPQTQGTLVNWYDASTLGLSNGADVSAFPDSKTGNPNTLATGTHSTTYATAQQNGLGAINWPATNAMSGGSSASTYPYTLMAIVKIANLTATKSILAGIENNGGLQLRIETSGAIGLVAGDIAYIAGSTSNISTGAYVLVVATVSSSSYAFYINGVAAGSGSHSVSLTGGRTFEMGLQKGNEEPFDGYIAEVQIYSSVLSSGDLSGLHTYAVKKWATP